MPVAALSIGAPILISLVTAGVAAGLSTSSHAAKRHLPGVTDEWIQLHFPGDVFTDLLGYLGALMKATECRQRVLEPDIDTLLGRCARLALLYANTDNRTDPKLPTTMHQIHTNIMASLKVIVDDLERSIIKETPYFQKAQHAMRGIQTHVESTYAAVIQDIMATKSKYAANATG